MMDHMLRQRKLWMICAGALACLLCLASAMGIGDFGEESSFTTAYGAEEVEQNVALSATVTTASEWSDPEGFWNSHYINDGHKLYAWPITVEGGTLGWRSASSSTREVAISLILELKQKATINRVVLYPRGGSAICFPDDYAVDLSLDGVTWQQVASVTGDTEVVARERELVFTKQEAQYVRLRVSKLSAEKDGNDCVCELSEMEVWGIVETKLEMNKKEIWMEVGAKDCLSASLTGQGQVEGLTYASQNPSVVTVDAKGNVLAVAPGDTTVTATDPVTNLTASCVVKVKAEEKQNIQIVVPMWANESLYTEEQFRWLREANVDIVMMVGAPNLGKQNYGNRALAIARKIYDENAERNLEVMLFGHQHGINVNSSEADLIAFGEQYRNTPLLAGYHLEDEPRDVNPFTRLVRILGQVDPFSWADVNFLPGMVYGDGEEPYGKGREYYGRLTDYAILTSQANTRLSFDNYPFTPQADSVDEYHLFGNFESLRQAGLTTGMSTCVYLQGVGSNHFGYRRPDADVLRYHMASALSYGFKTLKYFSWYVPGTMLTTEHELFTSGIMNVKGEKTDLYEDAKELNRQVHNVGDILVHLEAVEVYHTSDGPHDVYRQIPENFFAQVKGDEQAIVSLMVNEATGESYLMVVNKDFTAKKTISLSLKDVKSLVEIDKMVEDGTVTPNFKDGTLTRTFAPGEFALYRLPSGDYRTVKASASKNLLANATVSAIDSLGRDGYYVTTVNDGERNSTSVNRGWMYESDALTDGWLLFDLGSKQSFNRLDLYPAGEGMTCGNYFPSKLKILVSDDGEEWTEIYNNDKIGTVTRTVPVFRLNETSARYVKLVFPNSIWAALAEAELYLDDGTIPEPPKTSYQKPTLKEGENVAAGKIVRASSSNIDGAWNPTFATDGVKMTSWPTDQSLGWCAGFYTTADQTAWMRVDLGTVYPVDSVVLYPRGNGGIAFPIDYKVQLSVDGITWTDVATVVDGKTNVEEARTYTFDAVMAKYVRVYATKFSEETPGNYSCQISEIEVYCDETVPFGDMDDENSGLFGGWSQSSKILPWILTGGVLLLLGGATLGGYLWNRKRKQL